MPSTRNLGTPCCEAREARLHSLEEIDRRIRQLTGESPISRPFLCNGSPLGCQIAQVGINPGTDTPFWPYWNTVTGFNKKDWLSHYLNQRGKLGSTRDRIELLCDALAPLRCLELNLYHHYSKSEAKLEQEHRNTKLFDFMLQSVRPRLLVVHGNSPIRHLERVLEVAIEKEKFNAARIPGTSIRLEVFAAKRHFAYVSREYVTTLGERQKDRALTS